MICVKSLEKLTENDLPAAGSKAVALALISKKGIFVPAAFVVLTSAFDRFCEVSEIGSPITNILAAADIGNLPDLAQKSAKIKSLIAAKPLPGDIVSQIEDAYDTLNSGQVAVRSSAALEDKVMGSAPGRMDSYIGVDQASLIECVKNCWASAFSMGSLAYFLKAGIDLCWIKPSVLVQKMVDCEVSGAAFLKVAEATGKKILVIEAGPGLGVARAGAISSDHYELNIDPLFITEKKISGQSGTTDRPKKYIGQPDSFKEGHNAAQLVPKLTDDQIKWLTEVFLKIEKLFSSPQDVEWGFSNGRIAILRSRSRIKAVGISAKERVWSNINIAEVIPGIVPPLVSSNVIALIDPAFRSFLTMPEDEPLIRDIEGRLYFNATAIERSLALATKTKEFPIAKFFGGKSNAGQIKLTFAGKAGFLSYGVKVIFYSIVSSWTFRAKIGEAEKMSEELEKRVEAASDLEELFALELQAFVYLRSVTIRAIKTLLYPLTFYFIFTHLCKKWLVDKTGEKANSFMASGSRQIALIGAFEALWGLSRIIKNDRVLSHKFLKAQTITKAEAVLRDSPDAITAWREFLKKYGHRSVKEVDFSLPRWKEDPSFLINTLKLYLGASEDINPASKIEKLAVKREILLCETKRLLPRWKFAIFKSVLGSAESAQILRERVKAVLVSLLFPLRSVYLKIGLKLRERGFLKDADDIFYLSSDEIGALRSGSLPKDFGLADLVARRKNEYRRFAGPKIPETIINGKEALLVSDLDLRTRDYSVKFLQGLGVSSGIAQGVARIAVNIDELWKIKPGEILVCDRLDPGWTPVFVVVKGLVSNTGGLLSHASIVAREFGLPAVVNVELATSKILDGQKIIVDGNRGTVKIINGAGND